MTQATFQELLGQLHPHLEQQSTTMWLPFPTETWLAITLLKLAIQVSLFYISHLFRVGKATAGGGCSGGLWHRLGHAGAHRALGP